MRLLMFLLLVGAMQLSATVYSQNSTFNLKMENGNFEKVMKHIKSNSEYFFLYKDSDIAGVKDLDIDMSNATIQEILKVCLEGTNLVYSIKDNIIIIKRTVVSHTEAQQVKKVLVKGVVKDADGNTLPGVSVILKGTNSGVATDIDGKFQLNIDDKPGVVLVFSFVGMTSQEVKIGKNKNLVVVLKSDSEQLEEVVITGYQTISKERATGSFGKIDSKQISKPASNISERLVGTISGVQTRIDADGNIDFEIRGQTSLYADAQPLIVVDGFAIEGDFSSINPNDVESVTVLKDAAAASIWGAKAANGVIVVTTKHGKKGSTKVEVSSFVKFGRKLDLDYANPLASSADVLEYEQKGFDTGFFGSPYPPASYRIEDVQKSYSQAVTAMNENRLDRLSDTDLAATLSRLASQNNKSQIEEYLLQVPVTHQHNINISGGNDNMLNSLSLMFENRSNYYKGNSADKVMVNFKNSTKITDWLKFDFSGTLHYEKDNHDATPYGAGWGGPQSTLAMIKDLAPYDMLVNADGSYTNLNNTSFYGPILYNLVPTDVFPYSDWSYNPVTELNSRDLKATQLNARINAGLKFHIMDGLDYSTSIQYQMYTTENKDYYSDKTFYVRRMINTTSSWNRDYNTKPEPNLPLGGFLEMDKRTTTSYNFRNQLNFVKTFAEKHSINFVAGSEISSRVVEYTKSPRSYGYNDETLTVSEFPNGTTGLTGWNGYPLSPWAVNMKYTHSFSYTTDRYFSLYGNMSYTFDDKYSFTCSARTDASNLITDDPSYRYSPFWSVGAGWQLGKEDFMSKVDWLDRLNLRFTYGNAGNVDKSTSFKPLISVNPTANLYSKDIIASIASYGNPTLRWEKTHTYNFGIDYSILRGKLFGSIDVYNKQGKDLIIEQSIPSIHGTTTQKFNNGEMVNKGIELSIGTSLPIMGRDIVWKGNFNIAYNDNEITKLLKTKYMSYDLLSGGTRAYLEGKSASTMWAYQYAGMQNFGTEDYPVIQPAFYGPDGSTFSFSSYGSSEDARSYLLDEGKRVAPIIVGFQNSFKIYDFDLSFTITGKFGHVFRRQVFNYDPMWGGNVNVNDKYAEVKNDDGSHYPQIPTNEWRYYYWDRYNPSMDYATENASHIRFQEINLTYNVPQRFLDVVGLKGASIYGQANNVGTILFNDYDEDPEYPKGTLKPQATYVFGIKFNL